MRPDLEIIICRKLLSDGSDTYDLIVKLDDTCAGRTVLQAVTWGDAVRFAEGVKALAEKHTLNSCNVLEATP